MTELTRFIITFIVFGIIALVIFLYYKKLLKEEKRQLQNLKEEKEQEISKQIYEKEVLLDNLDFSIKAAMAEIDKLKEEQSALQRKTEREKEIYYQQSNKAQIITSDIERLKEKKGGLELNILQGKQLVDKEIAAYRQNLEHKQELEIIEASKKNTELFNMLHEEYINSLVETTTAIEEMAAEIADYQKIRDAINNEIIRAREVEEQTDFYRIVLTENDIEDLRTLEAISPRMRRRDIVPKLIWDAIVSRPTNEMIKRVTDNKVGGIYKITYIPTGEIYIGKTTDFKNRWKNHVGTALGMEKAASSTLHTHMARNGIENYTFEVLEECPKDKQSEREKYYIQFYQSDKFGLNMKSGG